MLKFFNKYKGLFFLIAFSFVFTSLHTVNKFVQHPLVYNANLFYNDISKKVIFEYITISLYLAAFFILIKTLFFIFSKINIVKEIQDRLSNMSKEIFDTKVIALMLFFIAILFKLILYNFDLDFGDRASLVVEKYFYGNEFNVYKAYTLIAGLLSILTENFNYYLSVLNVFLGSATISIWYLIASKTGKYSFNKVALSILILFYLPLTAAETILRVELLYIFFISLSVLVAINLSEKYTFKNLFYLNSILLICCFVREQTIYLLPLYLFLILIQMDKKYYLKSMLTISLTVIMTSSLISSHNVSKFGFDSLFRDRVLIQKIMQYGYLDDNFRSTYEKDLSPNAQLLLKDITSIYNTNLLPSRREIHIDKYDMPELWNLVRPHHQTIYQKTNLSTQIRAEDIAHIQSILRNLLAQPENINKEFNVKEISELMSSVYIDMNNEYYARLMKDFQFIITNDFYLENDSYLGSYRVSNMKLNNQKCINRGEPIDYVRIWNIQPPQSVFDSYYKQKFNATCLLDVISKANHGYFVSMRTNDFYHIAAQKVAPSFNPETQKYEIHPLLPHLKEIVASMPLLYFTQSIIVGISQTGYVPVPSGMSNRFVKVYENSYYPEFMLIDLQKVYYIFINFWYVFCFFAFILSFLINDPSKRNINLFLSIFPLYYGAFLGFATYGEFARLMLPIIPFILYCSFFTLFFIYKMIFSSSFLSNDEVKR